MAREKYEVEILATPERVFAPLFELRDLTIRWS
jgi:hypothetical protein